MRIVLALVGILALLIALGTGAMAKSAIQEAVAGVIAVISVLCFGFAAVLEEIQRSRKAMQEQFAFLAEHLKDRQP
jgi:hypothetical protein